MRNLLKNLQLKKLSRLLMLLLPLFFMANCEKDPSLSGNPGNDNLAKLDSTVFVAYTLADEARDALNEGDVVLGRLDDPRYGATLASFYSQFRLTTTAFTPGANAVLDSAVLVLQVEDAYGPLTNAMNVEVYRLTEAIVSATTYPSDQALSTDATLLGGLNGFVYNDESAIRVPLTQTFGNELFSLFGTSTTESNDNFLSYLNGLHVTLDPNSGGDGLIDLNITLCTIQLYFRSDVATDSLYSFVIDEQTLRVNHYETDLTGSEVETAINDPSDNDESLLIGGLQVSKGKIVLPDLSVLQGSIINQAKLSFYQADYGSSLNTDYALPEFLLLTGSKDNDTIVYFLSDYSTSSPTAYGGTPKLINYNGTPTFEYSYTIPLFIQRVVNQETEITSLNIEVLNFNNGNSVKLGGGTHPDFPIKLEILYTKP